MPDQALGYANQDGGFEGTAGKRGVVVVVTSLDHGVPIGVRRGPGMVTVPIRHDDHASRDIATATHQPKSLHEQRCTVDSWLVLTPTRVSRIITAQDARTKVKWSGTTSPRGAIAPRQLASSSAIDVARSIMAAPAATAGPISDSSTDHAITPSSRTSGDP
jgi:hypothetical protein